jgi:hypothetical protein
MARAQRSFDIVNNGTTPTPTPGPAAYEAESYRGYGGFSSRHKQFTLSFPRAKRTCAYLPEESCRFPGPAAYFTAARPHSKRLPIAIPKASSNVERLRPHA